jgi:hypothetical protein
LDLVVVLLTLALLGAVIAIVGAPLNLPYRRREVDADEVRRGELEAARESKYREIRDTELDYRLGKLSEADHESISATLRAEAAEILRGLDDLDGAVEHQPDEAPAAAGEAEPQADETQSSEGAARR